MNIKGFVKELKAKAKLRRAFKSAGLINKHKNGEKEIVVYPKIHEVTFDEKNKSIRYVFTLINGMDPKEVSKKEYVFMQHFGKAIDLKGDYKKFQLTVYEKPVTNNLLYNFEEIHPKVSPYRVGIICGKNRNGQYVAFDLAEMPHILLAGETGSGKSTQLRSILTTLIKTKRPEELQLYLGDCKKQEFHIFRRVEHVQCVYSKPGDIRKMLTKIKAEMETRSDLTETFEVGHIDDLPIEHRKPYIIVCIDEFVMLRKDDEIMEILTEIVAIGRTLGVFAILSMQRPNAKVLDTTVRANLTVCMGFKLRDALESKIANTPNAEKIEIKGRFIMNSDKVYEIQAPFLEMNKAKKLLNPFYVSKGPVKEIHPEEPKQKQLQEDEVFNEVLK